LRHIVGQKLEGDKPTELHILSLEHHTHPAATELLNDAVVRDGLADHERELASARLRMVGRSDGQVNADAQMLSFEISPHFRTARSPLPGLALRRLSLIDLRVAQVPTAS
jgi:hypothetical protein